MTLAEQVAEMEKEGAAWKQFAGEMMATFMIEANEEIFSRFANEEPRFGTLLAQWKQGYMHLRERYNQE